MKKATKKEEVREVIKVVEKIIEVPVYGEKEKSEKERLLEVYEFMVSRGINSIGNLENLISKM